MEMNLHILVGLPLVCGFVLFLFRNERLNKNLALLVLLLGFIWSINAAIRPAPQKAIELIGNYSLILGSNRLSGLIIIFVNLFGLLTCLYSRDMENKGAFFSYLAWLIGFSNLALLSADFITFIFSWGATLALLYALLNLGSGRSAKKAFSIVGFADFSLMLGVCLYIAVTNSAVMPQGRGLALDNPMAWFSFILMLVGAFAKAGCAPFHTWITTAAEDAPVPVMAILPGSLDKLLGIYLLARVSADFFVLNGAAMAILLLTGGLTIIFAVMMALIQHDLRKLLSFHAVSQVGYMVLGFGTGNALGFAGGIFHMINNAVYKSGLFLVGGAVEKRKKTFELEELGGLAAYMPLTFISGLVFALSISGIPPLNGFASKWMLYQGALSGMFNTPNSWLRLTFLFAIIAAMFGSALTLASFIKFIHAIFLGEGRAERKAQPKEVSFSMVFPLLILALLCVLLGVFPKLFIGKLIEPWVGQAISFSGSWDSLFVFIFLAAGLAAGAIVYFTYASKGTRQDGAYTGCETAPPEPSYPATEFYKTIQSMPLAGKFYGLMKQEALDVYNILSGILTIAGRLLYIFIDRLIYVLTSAAGYSVLGLSWVFRKMHSGVLDQYLAWSLAGLLAMFFILMAK
ncbi:MAG: proton-conducting transporter membrane subunit [Candidatus Omnitrophica bacterium]|nr:proton-conducting transporter membrane subunit [Candidatus Omnitrophota bacterium]MDD5552321.1 proton-conducting transporter membrane subunit [Candidatus Omnitrophota bacterium]